MVQTMRSGGALRREFSGHLFPRRFPKQPLVLSMAAFLAACGTTPVAKIDTQSTPVVAHKKKTVRVATLAPAKSTVGLAAVTPDVAAAPMPISAPVRDALLAYHGDAKYICSPSGFGQKSSCRLRDRSG